MPAVVHQTPKISPAMWESLKLHIMKQRERVKQEEEADAEEERQRKEKERKRKADELTIEDTKEKIAKLEQDLLCLKNEKHNLFISLKKVLHEDENRKRQSSKENNEMFGIPAAYPSGHLPLGGHHSHMLMHPMAVGAPGARIPLYSKMGAPVQQVPVHSQTQSSGLPPPPGAALKRPRSPSPQPPGYQQGYPQYKTVPYQPQKHVGGGPHYGGAAASAFYPPQAPVPMTQPHASPSYSYQYPAVTSSEAAKHAGAYAHQNRGSGTSRSARISVPQGTSILPIQQTAPKAGSITSGYPVRPPPQSMAFQASTTHQSIYSHPNTVPRPSYSQPHQMRY